MAIRSGKFVAATSTEFPAASANTGALAQALDTGTLYISDGTSWNVVTSLNSSGYLIGEAGAAVALSEAVTEVAATASAGATVHTGAGFYAGYRCTVAAGNITVYDNTSAAGKVLVPTTALAVGSFPIYGAGTNHRLVVDNGVHVVLSGAATVYIGVE